MGYPEQAKYEIKSDPKRSLNPLNAGQFSKNRLYCRLLLKTFKICLIFIGNGGPSSKQVGSQASRRVTRLLAWIQPVCISINAVPALKGLILFIG